MAFSSRRLPRRSPRKAGPVSYTHLDVYKRQVLTPLLDFRTSKGNEILVHPEDDWKANVPVGGDAKQNLCASGGYEGGDLEAVFADCDLVLERTFHTKANNQTMMEPFNTYCTMDTYGPVSYTHLDVYKRQSSSWGRSAVWRR